MTVARRSQCIYLGLVSELMSSWAHDMSVYMVAGNNIHHGSGRIVIATSRGSVG